MGRMLDDEPYNAKFRAGIFFISFCFIICQLGTNLAWVLRALSVHAGDLADPLAHNIVAFS